MNASPWISGMTAGCPATAVSSRIVPRKTVPMIDSFTSVSPGWKRPRACSWAIRPAVPDPVGERSSSRSANTQALAWVDDGERGVRGVLDLRPEVLQAAGFGFADVQSEAVAVDVQVEGPAIGDVAR